ncbi:26S proteasome non-ATPase regulatory subunit 3 [Stylophora pistillata]|uniref:26S proteasome non-ATPase regulatory subunit 3 n=1 Tax=Stylophora pistillata TaxID=50429 RepID=A0A2B4S880_STYPI|nr:26S proteasome non-ATPase regulatory subunit 3 [Stylophora pistillata]
MAKQDVEMKEEPKQNDSAESEEPKAEVSKEEKERLVLEDLKDQVKYIEKSVSSKEPRFVTRVLRAIPATRKKLTHAILRKLICGFFPNSSVARDGLLAFLDEPMESELGVAFRPRSARLIAAAALPEVEFYFHLLVLIHLIDTECFKEAVKCSELLMQRSLGHNRRTLDPLLAKCYFYHSRAYELVDRLQEIRSFLLARLRTATLRHDDEGQAILLNLLLRNYLQLNLYDQAEKLVSKSSFPETASTNEWARFLYYTGIIKAIQLDYSEAHKNLLQAIRKAPQQAAIGFKQTAHKFAIVVQLLLGEIPDRATFREPFLRKTLVPYFQLTQDFGGNRIAYINDRRKETYLEKVTNTAAMLPIRDIKMRKAIRDGVIDATIDHEKGHVQSKENVDIYSTNEPQGAFHQRVSFCLDLYNQSVKAMRFPPKSYSKNLESLEEQREREKQDLELAKEMAEDDDDFP